MYLRSLYEGNKYLKMVWSLLTVAGTNEVNRVARVFFSVWRPVRTASALDNWQIRYSAPKMEEVIIRSAHRR